MFCLSIAPVRSFIAGLWNGAISLNRKAQINADSPCFHSSVTIPQRGLVLFFLDCVEKPFCNHLLVWHHVFWLRSARLKSRRWSWGRRRRKDIVVFIYQAEETSNNVRWQRLRRKLEAGAVGHGNLRRGFSGIVSVRYLTIKAESWSEPATATDKSLKQDKHTNL